MERKNWSTHNLSLLSADITGIKNGNRHNTGGTRVLEENSGKFIPKKRVSQSANTDKRKQYYMPCRELAFIQ